MPFSRKISLAAAVTAQCLFAAHATAAHAQSSIPDYFFKEWTVSSNCAEQNAGLAAKVQSGLKFTIPRASAAADGSYVFVAEDSSSQQWAANWNGLKLQYRAGTPMQTLPADFECVAGDTAASSFLSMSGYAVSAEPYYQQEHWYGLARIQGQLEHVLIFPRNVAGAPSAVIVLQSVNSASTVQLDDNGVIHANW